MEGIVGGELIGPILVWSLLHSFMKTLHMKSLIYTTLAFCGLIALSIPAYSQIHVSIGPPRARVEVRPARPDHHAIWIKGYHDWDADQNKYVWRSGHWDHAPAAGQVWVAPVYRHEHHGVTYVAPHWQAREEKRR
jgi:hypothetical protein